MFETRKVEKKPEKLKNDQVMNKVSMTPTIRSIK